MKAIILVGGKGLRLRSLINDIPKPMAPVAGRPFLEYLVLQVKKWGGREITLCTGYKADIVRDHFANGDRWGIRIGYSEETVPLGTGGALRNAAYNMSDTESLVVMNGDSFLDVDMEQLLSHHGEHRARATISLACVADTSRYGRVETNESGEIVSFHEKGSGGKGTINGGVYVFDPAIIKSIPLGTVSLETEVLPKIINKGLFGMEVTGSFTDIGIPEDYLRLDKDPKSLFEAAGITDSVDTPVLHSP